MEATLKLIDCKPEFRFQGPRVRELGPESGEEFRDDYLIPWLKNFTDKDVLTIDFEGTLVYTPSFLEEAFGGAIRNGFVIVKILKFINLPKKQKDKINKYIDNALKHKK